jgi:hypothetical protein
MLAEGISPIKELQRESVWVRFFTTSSPWKYKRGFTRRRTDWPALTSTPSLWSSKRSSCLALGNELWFEIKLPYRESLLSWPGLTESLLPTLNSEAPHLRITSSRTNFVCISSLECDRRSKGHTTLTTRSPMQQQPQVSLTQSRTLQTGRNT